MGEVTLLPEQIIKIILAIAAIIFILYVGIVLFQQFFGRTDELQAKGTLLRLSDKLSSLRQDDVSSVLLYVPKGWTIIYFEPEVNKIEKYSKPSSFWNKRTLCICGKNCKKEICKEIRLPLLQNNQPFFWPIVLKNFYVHNNGTIYNISDKKIEIKVSSQESNLVKNIKIDASVPSLKFQVSRLSTPFENDFTTWSDFYNSVKEFGYGLGKEDNEYFLYSSEKIKETREESEKYTGSECEFGLSEDGACLKVGRTIFANSDKIPLYSVVLLKFDCTKSTCESKCETWNHNYVVQDNGKEISENQIELFVGGGKESSDETSCLPNEVEIWIANEKVTIDQLKEDDKPRITA